MLKEDAKCGYGKLPMYIKIGSDELDDSGEESCNVSAVPLRRELRLMLK
jgi:hypothetical protein